MALYLRESIEGARLARERGAITCVVDAFGAGLVGTLLIERGARSLVLTPCEQALEPLADEFEHALCLREDPKAPFRCTASTVQRSPTQALRDKAAIWPGGPSAGVVAACGQELELYLGSAINAPRLARFLDLRARETERDVVVIAAASARGPGAVQEDLWVAAYLASLLETPFSDEDERKRYDQAIAQVIKHGLRKLFQREPVARRLRAQQRAQDLDLAARPGTSTTVLRCVSWRLRPDLPAPKPIPTATARRRRRRRARRREGRPVETSNAEGTNEPPSGSAQAHADPESQKTSPTASKPQDAVESPKPPARELPAVVSVFERAKTGQLWYRYRL